MGTQAFQAGSRFEVERKVYTLRRKIDVHTWQAEESRTLRIEEFVDQELRRGYARGTLRFISDTAPTARPGRRTVDTSSPIFAKARMRAKYIKAIDGLPSTLAVVQPAVNQVWNEIKLPLAGPPAARSVLRWRRRYRIAGFDIHGIVDRHSDKGNKRPRVSPKVSEFVAEAIAKVYMSRERKTVQDTLDAACALIANENRLEVPSRQLALPSYSYVHRKINEIAAFDRYAARYGRDAAARRFRSVKGHTVAEAPLSRAEMDHTVLDLTVVDESTGMPLGRPTLSVVLDVYSRCILGLHISFDPPSYLSVARCLKNALLPKADLRERYPSIRSEWPAHGVMDQLVVDNGLEFHSEALENACSILNIEIVYAPRKAAWFKGSVERFLGTLNRGVAHKAPGTSFANITDKGDYDVIGHAAVSYPALLEIVLKWVADVYHQQPHSSLDMPPVEAWRRGIADEEIRLAEDPALLDAILAEPEQRTLTHQGILYDGLYYNSPALAALRSEHGETIRVDIRIDRGDLGSIVVLTNDKTRYIKVPALDQEYASGLTSWQHSVIRTFAAKRLRAAGNEGWRQAKAEIAEMIRDQIGRQKGRTRKRLGRYLDRELRDSPPPASGPSRGSTTAPPTAGAFSPDSSSETNAAAERSAADVIQPAGHAIDLQIAASTSLRPRKAFKTKIVDRTEPDEIG